MHLYNQRSLSLLFKLEIFNFFVSTYFIYTLVIKLSLLFKLIRVFQEEGGKKIAGEIFFIFTYFIYTLVTKLSLLFELIRIFREEEMKSQETGGARIASSSRVAHPRYPPTTTTTTLPNIYGSGGSKKREKKKRKKRRVRGKQHACITRRSRERDDPPALPLFTRKRRRRRRRKGFNAQLALTEPERIADRNVDEVSRSRYTS